MSSTRIIIALLFYICLQPSIVAAQNNPVGVMLMNGGDADTAGMLHHYRLARTMIGEWGYVRVGTNIDDNSIDDLVQTITACRALHLIPVLTARRLPDEYYDPTNKNKPRTDTDGSLTTFEKGYENWLRKVYARGITIPYFEYGNEVNTGFYDAHPEVYAQMCIAASKGFKRIDPNLSFGPAGMAGCAREFYEKMLTRVPELTQHLDHYGFHPYGVNHPPGYTHVFDDYGLDCHSKLAETLARFGVKNPVFIATETGYELGNERDKRFPKITEELRAKYLVEEYQKYWIPDPRVKAIMLFMLQDVRWQGWNGWDFVREDYTLTPMYEALRDMPKPAGQDYMPSGACSVSGQITERTLKTGIPDTIVWIRRAGLGCWAAVTDDEGYFKISGVLAGPYSISSYRDGFSNSSVGEINLSAGTTTAWSASVDQVGMIKSIDGQAGSVAPGWMPSGSEAGLLVDTAIKRTGTGSQKMLANGNEQSIYQVSEYESVLPDKVYAAEVWVKTRGLASPKSRGVGISLALTDSFNITLAEAFTSLDTVNQDGWVPLAVVIKSIPKARRLRVTLYANAAAGQIWFDDIFVTEANRPLPSALSAHASNASVGGSIVAGEKLLSDATVYLNPLGLWATTDSLGQFKISNVPDGRYRLSAVSPGYQSASRKITVDPAHTEPVQISLQEIPVATELVDPGFEDIPKISSWFTGWHKFGTTEGIVAAGSFSILPEHRAGLQPHSGKGYYGAVAGSNIKDGGLYQTIAVEPNALYEVSVWSYTYQTAEGSRGDVANRLGVDPMGGNDPASPYVIWSPLRPSHKQWTKITLQVRPVKSRMTIYLHHLQVQGLTFNANAFDDAEVKKIGPPADW